MAMIFMFIFPLFLGFLPSLILSLKNWGRLPVLWNDGVLMLTAWSLLKGVLEIYGSESVYVPWFFFGGLALLLMGVLQIMFKKTAKAS